MRDVDVRAIVYDFFWLVAGICDVFEILKINRNIFNILSYKKGSLKIKCKL